MKILKYLLKKEFLQIRRNKFLLRLIIIMPVMQLVLLPWAATFEQKNINLVVIDNDRSMYSQNMIEKITASGYFKLINYSDSYNRGLQNMESGNADIILEIPQHFEKDFVNNQPVSVMSTINAINGQKATVGMSYISEIINTYNQEIASDFSQRGIIVKPYYKYNKEMNYRNYMVPGIIVILLTLIGGMLSAMNIVREKEIGTMEQINVTPVSKSLFILSKLIPFWVIGLILLTISMFIAWLVYGLIPVGAFINIYLFALLYLMAFTGLGLMVSNFAETQQQAMFMIFFVLIIFILLSGLFTPISSMPKWAQYVTAINPLRYFVEVMRLIYMKGSGFIDILPHILKISGFVFAFNLLAIFTYRKKMG